MVLLVSVQITNTSLSTLVKSLAVEVKHWHVSFIIVSSFINGVDNMLAANNIRSSKSISNKMDHDNEPLELDELLTLIGIAAQRGYSVREALDNKSLRDEISSELITVWYAIENSNYILVDMISHLIEFTGWKRSSLSVYQKNIQQYVSVPLAA